ncbi:TPA: RNA-splicing ligase RtcB [Pyrococcus horikoshii]|uniref:tRNA-splicing ligase RtcB n=1 Tax=Pyrococcus horikoshii TaxID=53953 RepID=A0A832T3E6_PYRHR|nr:RNA-splicing ligase RtcB [Pyrococcus horikoshii]
MVPLKRIDKIRWEIPKFDKRMRVPGRVYADEVLLEKMKNDRTLEQATNVAMLPGIYKYSIVMPDGHQGYGFPIGGVAAFDVKEGVISPGGIGYDINCLAPGTRVLTEHGYWLKIEEMPEKFKLQRLRVYNIEEGHNDFSKVVFVAEREVGSEEKAIRIVTESGKVIEGSEDHPVLTPEGYVYLRNVKEGDYILVYPFEGVPYEEKKGVILDESAFEGEDPQVVKFLRERNLIPLQWKDPKVGILARILGFALANGYISENDNLTFHGKEEVLREVRKDLEELGIEAIVAEEDKLKVTSREFAFLLEKLGMAHDSIPEWIIEGPLWIKRNFLAGLFGANGSIVEFKGDVPLPITLTHSRELLNDVSRILEGFKVRAKIKMGKNGSYQLVIEDEDSIRNFLGRINYEYDPEKKARGLIAYAYLKFKELMKGNLMTFEEFARDRGYEGGFVAEKVIEVKSVKPEYDKFYDIGVYHSAHNFIANGIVVHNCGVRLIRTNLTEKEVRPRIKQLVDTLFKNVPSGVGSQGRIKLHWTQIDDVLVDGAKWAVDNGYGWERDLERLEEGGRMEGADPEAVSQRAKQRGAPQLGSLGSGNHFLEVQVVDKIFDPEVAKAYGLFEGQVVVMVHTGSRGLGHQVASDYLRIMERAIRKYRIPWPDRELVSVPFQSEEGQRYFSAMKAAANFAWANRQMITHWVRESFQEVFKQDPEGDLGMDIVYDVAHNIGKVEEHEVDGKRVKVIVHRKGATRAFPPGHEAVPRLYRDVGQPVLIPGSMGTASYILAGTEGAMKETFGSTCHGAGRVLSRKAATRQYRGDRIRQELLNRGIYVRAASMRVVAEEAPGAYKNVDNVVKVVSEAGIAKLVARMRPIGVAKG